MVIALRDSTTLDLDAIILTKTTTDTDIQDIIDDLKEELGDDFDGDLFEEIEKRLPDDCEVYASWANQVESVWY